MDPNQDRSVRDVAPPLAINLNPLPEGFKNAVLRELQRVSLPGKSDGWPDQFVVAVANAWDRSTNRQRSNAEAGVIDVLMSIVPSGAFTAWHMGYLAARCNDLDMTLLVSDPDTGMDRDWTSDAPEYLRGVWDGRGVRVAPGADDLLFKHLRTLARDVETLERVERVLNAAGQLTTWEDARHLCREATPLSEGVTWNYNASVTARALARHAYLAAAKAVDRKWSRAGAPNEAWTRAGLPEDHEMNRPPMEE